MSKTVLELTAEEKRAYRILPLPSQINRSELTKRWQRAWQAAQQAASLLRSRFGAKRVVLFGSLSDQALFSPWSDIDLAVEGIPVSEFYRAVGVVSGLSTEFEIDLIDIDDCKATIRQVVEQEGVPL